MKQIMIAALALALSILLGACGAENIEVNQSNPKDNEKTNVKEENSIEEKPQNTVNEDPSSKTGTEEVDKSDTDTLTNPNLSEETSKPPGNQEKYGNRIWKAKDENNFIYELTLTFENENKGLLDFKVIDEASGEQIEEISQATFELEGTVGYFSYVTDLNEQEQGQIKLQEDSVEFSRYRNTLILN